MMPNIYVQWYHAYKELKRWNRKQAFITNEKSPLFLWALLACLSPWQQVVDVSSQENKDLTLQLKHIKQWLSLKVLTRLSPYRYH